MKRMTRNTQGGFSLVELLAVVLILAVLAAVAVPLYINTRKSAAARACKGNLAAIAAAASAYALRNGQYPSAANVLAAYDATALPDTGLIGAPEGLSSSMSCPLDNVDYVITGGGTTDLVITCPHASTAAGGDNLHETVVPSPAGTEAYQRTMAAPQPDNLP